MLSDPGGRELGLRALTRTEDQRESVAPMTSCRFHPNLIRPKNPMPRSRPGHQIITPSEARTAIFIDYEATTKRAPTLLGVRIEKATQVWVLETAFQRCVGLGGASRTLRGDHSQCVTALVDRATQENRVIISWSEHDLRLMEPALAGDTDRLASLHAQYRDAKKSGRRWMARQSERRRAAVLKNGHKLEVYRTLFNVHQPEHFGSGVAGNAMRLLRSQLHQGRPFRELSEKARESWHVLVRHNEFDLTSLQQVCERIAEGMQVPAAPKSIASPSRAAAPSRAARAARNGRERNPAR
ncbi:MAG: hypothetical protein RL698_2427 [Pseudomonadota bacterium]